MRAIFGIMYIVLIPFLVWSRWNSEHFVFITLLFAWIFAAVAYLISVERD